MALLGVHCRNIAFAWEASGRGLGGIMPHLTASFALPHTSHLTSCLLLSPHIYTLPPPACCWNREGRQGGRHHCAPACHVSISPRVLLTSCSGRGCVGQTAGAAAMPQENNVLNAGNPTLHLCLLPPSPLYIHLIMS